MADGDVRGECCGNIGEDVAIFARGNCPCGGQYEQVTLPAWTMLIYWIVFQVFGGLGSLGLPGGGIAYMAHVGGFLAGVVLVKFFEK